MRRVQALTSSASRYVVFMFERKGRWLGLALALISTVTVTAAAADWQSEIARAKAEHADGRTFAAIARLEALSSSSRLDLELAALYLAVQDYAAAASAVRRVLADDDLPEPVRVNAQLLLLRIQDEAQTTHDWQGSLSASMGVVPATPGLAAGFTARGAHRVVRPALAVQGRAWQRAWRSAVRLDLDQPLRDGEPTFILQGNTGPVLTLSRGEVLLAAGVRLTGQGLGALLRGRADVDLAPGAWGFIATEQTWQDGWQNKSSLGTDWFWTNTWGLSAAYALVSRPGLRVSETDLLLRWRTRLDLASGVRRIMTNSAENFWITRASLTLGPRAGLFGSTEVPLGDDYLAWQTGLIWKL